MSNTQKVSKISDKPDPRGVTKLQIGGKRRTLRFDANAFIEAQDATGCDSIEDALNLVARLDMRICRALLWAGLLHEDEDLAIADVGSWLGAGPGRVTVVKVVEPLMRAVHDALGEELEKDDDEQSPTRGGRGTGEKSSTPPSEQD